MLLYTHRVNEERGHGGLQPVNSFWISGAGALPAAAATAPPSLQIVNYLRDAALLGDWPAWAAAWKQLDAKECPRLLQALGEGRPVAITLSGERSARTWSSEGAGWLRRLSAPFTRKQAAMLLEPL